MNKTNYDWGVKQTDNWCCNTDCAPEGSELVGFRKNIILKSAQKNDKNLKTSLKKRAGSNQTYREPQKYVAHQDHEPKLYPIKQPVQSRNIKPAQTSFILQRFQIAQTSIPSANCIRYTPQKSNHQPKKINFIYNNKNNLQVQKLAVADLQALNTQLNILQPKIQHKTISVPPNVQYNNSYNTPYNTTFQSQHKNELGKSTQNTYFNSEKGESYVDNLGKSRNFKMQPFSLGFSSERGKDRQPLNTLTSRKDTVLSVNGDSQSQSSIAIMDFDDLNLLKLKSIQTAKMMEQRHKFNPSGLRSSLNI